MAFLILDPISGRKVVVFGSQGQINLLSSLSPEPVEVLQFAEFSERCEPSENPFELTY